MRRPVRARHLLVDFRDDDFRRVRRRARRVHRRAERTPPVCVRRRKLEQRRIERHLAGVKKSRDVREEDRDEIRAVLLDRFPERRTCEKRDRSKAPRVLRLRERHRPREVQVVEPHVFEIRAPHHRIEQRRRRRARAVDEHARAAFQQRHGIRGGHRPARPAGIARKRMGNRGHGFLDLLGKNLARESATPVVRAANHFPSCIHG